MDSVVENSTSFVPASSAKDLELGGSEPAVARGAFESHELFFAGPTPSVRTSGVRIVAPEEADGLPSIDRVRNVGTHETNSLIPVPWTVRCFGHVFVCRMVLAFSGGRTREPEGRPTRPPDCNAGVDGAPDRQKIAPSIRLTPGSDHCLRVTPTRTLRTMPTSLSIAAPDLH